MRARAVDGLNASPEDPSSKGGRSLRKRARVDYSFDQADEDDPSIEAKGTPTTTRVFKKRKADLSPVDDDFEEEDLDAQVKRRASEQPTKPPMRRSIGRKSTVEPPSFVADQQDEEVTVQDTIEVGGHHSEQASDTSSHQHTNSDSSQKESAPSTQPLSHELAPPTAFTQLAPISITKTEITEEPESLDEPEIKSETQKDVEITHIEIRREQPPASRAHQEPLQQHREFPAASPNQAVEAAKPVSEKEVADPYAHLTLYVDGTTSYPASKADAAAQEVSEATEAPAEEPAADDVAEELNEAPDESTPAGSPGLAEDTAANSPAPDVDLPEVPAPPAKNQYKFKKLRPAQDFIDFIENFENMSPEELYERLEFLASRVLAPIQKEYNNLRKKLDDEENAVRYHVEEAAYQHRKKLARSKDPDANPLRKDFTVKGSRAPKPDPIMAYQRQQDRVMADAYYFDYDEREGKVGQQDPIGQRGGIGKGRLRDRPKQTAKAAEADDGNVVHGKRPRKAPNLYGESEPASRGSTPAPTGPRKRRGRQPAEENGIHHLSVPSEVVPEETPKKRKGGRPRKHPLPVPVVEDSPAPHADLDAAEESKGPSRKRRRKNMDDEEFSLNGTNGQASSGPGGRRRNSRIGEIPAGSFYSATSMGNDESRPATSSSTATVSTTASGYGLRHNRQTKFSMDDDDGDFEDEEEQPKPKRVRRVPKKVQEQDFANIPASNIPSEPDAVLASKVPKIRVKGFQPNASAPVSAPTSNPSSLPPSHNSSPGQAMNGSASRAADAQSNGNKDYGQMTKSEKMSASMKGMSHPILLSRVCPS
jgi:hypothetical protein